ncbi:hypothetical protein Fot_22791 [Forsythia ovata]|uniref:Uncharacterized protein n=1 Tax=Forsythia ovata TaxID=205694 RepID=A0ABD1UYQ3_9LAMI
MKSLMVGKDSPELSTESGRTNMSGKLCAKWREKEIQPLRAVFGREIGDNCNISYTSSFAMANSHVASLDKQLLCLWDVEFSNQRSNKKECSICYLGSAGGTLVWG